MIDPLSIAGLAISVIDGLIKLGERTAELVSDVRAFDDVSIHNVLFNIHKRFQNYTDDLHYALQDMKNLHNLICDENLRTRLLRGLLFAEASVRRGSCTCTIYSNL
jgi:hypothetical protein